MNSSTLLQMTPEDDTALRHRHDLEYLLLGDLRQLLAEPRTRETRAALLATIDELLKHLPQQLALESSDGYAFEVVALCPHLEVQTQSLRRADLACYSLLKAMRDRIRHQLPFSRIAHQTRRNLRHWMELLAAHRQQEGQLLQKAFTVDLGGEG